MTADLKLVRGSDQQGHCAWLRAAADRLLEADEPEVDLDKVAHQLQDYAVLLEHAEREGWWDR